MDITLLQRKYDETSFVVDTSKYDARGFAEGCPLRRHKLEEEANRGAHEARRDWINLIGPIDQFGNCNPYHGNFTSIVLPFTRPDRLALAAYIHEFAFLYDNVLESTTLGQHQDDQLETPAKDAKIGAKQIESKIIFNLLKTDRDCALRIIKAWETMIRTTKERKDADPFQNFDEYVTFRSIDTGAPFVEAIMLFGMGLTLTEEEDSELQNVASPCFAALGLANDYFSFDREYGELLNSKQESITNAVWLCMQWQKVSVRTAKQNIKGLTNSYEKEFLRRREALLKAHPTNSTLRLYVDGLMQQIIGNVVWSLHCPRYNPTRRYNPNAAIENMFLFRSPTVLEVLSACNSIYARHSADDGENSHIVSPLGSSIFSL